MSEVCFHAVGRRKKAIARVRLIPGEGLSLIHILRTVAMDFWATLEHGIRYKSSDEVPAFIVDELRNCADVITRTDAKMQEIFKALQLLNDKEDDFHWRGSED